MATTKITNPELFDLGSLNTALKLPSGTTAERPTSPSTGEWRYNTTTNLVEFWDGGEWTELQSEDLPPIPSENFNTVLYTGNGTSQSITGVGFQPDLVWIKARNVTYDHALTDSTRGTTHPIYIEQNGELTNSTFITSFDADGFSIGNNAVVNNNTNTYVAWCWKANGGTTTAGTGTGGVSSVTHQLNSKAGFCITKFTSGSSAGGTVTHGLDSAPDLIFMKATSSTQSWWVWSSTFADGNQYIQLQSTAAQGSSSNVWNSTAPSASVVTLGAWNSQSFDYIMYAFKSKAGYSKFGTYTGNGSANGPIVETGFEPAFLMIKNTSSTESGGASWLMYDNKRNTSNPRNSRLWANLSGAEYSTACYDVDFLSNGFQIAAFCSTYGMNESGDTYLYMAFASDPTAAPVLADSFGVETYQGNGTTQSLAGYGFTPSMIWFKARTVAYDHGLYDRVRGGGSLIYPNLTQAASTVTNGVLSFDSSGVTIGANNKQNASDSTYVGWAWKANSIPTINTDGTIQSLVSANQASGFSVVKYTTTTDARVGHGLSQAPEIVLQKTLSSANSFFFANNLVSGTDDWEYLEMANDNAQTTNWTYYDGAEAPNATTFKDGWPNNTEMITYCFHSVDGFSKFGSYTGTGTSPGPTVTIGFQPDFLMIKSTSIAGAWFIMDSRRSPSNPRQLLLQPQSAAVEQNVGNAIDFNADNFQILDTNASRNASGQTYIYMAFKENPTQYPIPSGEMGYLVVAGGGGGGAYNGGGGGSGGLRTTYGTASGGGASVESNITLSAQTYTITVGAGGSGQISNTASISGSSSSVASITSIGGGSGGGAPSPFYGPNNGGSGGGGAYAQFTTGGTGTANQGFAGGDGDGGVNSGGGGGAGSAGTDATGAGGTGGNGGNGLTIAITGSSGGYAGGGGGAGYPAGGGAAGSASSGGGSGGANSAGAAGAANTGGGGGGSQDTANPPNNAGGNGGSGIVVLRMNTSDYSGTTTGSPTVTTVGTETVLTYTGSGTYVHS